MAEDSDGDHFLCLPITSMNHPVVNIISQRNFGDTPVVLIQRPNNSVCHCKRGNISGMKTFECQMCRGKYHNECYFLRRGNKDYHCIYCQHHVVSLCVNSLKEYLDILINSINEAVGISKRYKERLADIDKEDETLITKVSKKMKVAENVTDSLRKLQNDMEQSIQSITYQIRDLSCE